MRFKKVKNFNDLVTILLISINFLLFILLILVCYIAVESKRVFQKKLSSLDQKVEKNLGNLSHLSEVKESLDDLSKIGKKIDTEAIKEKIAELTVSINKLGNLEDIKQKMGELGKEFSQELRNDLSSLNNLASNLREIKDNLKNLKEIGLQLKGLSNLEGIKESLRSLGDIKNDINKIKMPGGSKELESIKEKLAGLEKEGQTLINEFSKIKNSTICQKCGKQKIVMSSSPLGAYINDLTLKEKVWIEWMKAGDLKLRYKERSSSYWTYYWKWSEEKEIGKNDTNFNEIKGKCKNKRDWFKVILKGYKCPDCQRDIIKLEGLEKYKYMEDVIKIISEI